MRRAGGSGQGRSGGAGAWIPASAGMTEGEGRLLGGVGPRLRGGDGCERRGRRGVWVVRLWDSFGFRLLVVSGGTLRCLFRLRCLFGWRALAGLWLACQDATRREVPLRPLDLSRVDLLVSGTGVTPDGSAYSPLRRMASGRARPSLGAPMARQADSGPHKTSMPRLCLAAVRRRHHCGWTPATERWFYAVCLEQVGAGSRFRSASGRVRWGLRPFATA